MTRQRVYPANSVSGDVYLEPQRGFWSIVRPLNRDIINYIVNPSFENTTRHYWHHHPGVLNTTLDVVRRSPADQTVAFSGNYALRLTQTLPGSPYGINYSPAFWGEAIGQIPVLAGGEMYVMAHVRAAPGDTIRLQVDIDGVIAAVVPRLVGRTTDLLATGRWQRIKVMVNNQLPHDQDVQIWLTIIPGPKSIGLAWVDAICATRYDISDYFDGDSPGATWAYQPFESVSTMSRFSRFIGEEIFLNDIGFNITSFQGHGMPPMINDTLPYGQGGGAYYNRSWPDTRTITLTGQFESRYGIKDLHKMQSRLVELVGLHRYYVDPQPFMLRYRLTCGDAETTGVLEIPVVYKAGLEGTVNNLYQERVILQLEAFEELFWRTWGTQTFALTANVVTPICYQGTAPAAMRIYVEGQTVGGLNVDFASIVNQTLGAGLYWRQDVSHAYQPVFDDVGLVVGDLDRVCSQATLREDFTDVTYDVTGHLVRPASVPAEFVLVHGVNDILATVIPYVGVTPVIYVTFRERYLSATDIWRTPRTGARGVTYDPLKFLEECR